MGLFRADKMKKWRIVPEERRWESMSEWAKEIAELVKADRKAAKRPTSRRIYRRGKK